MDKSVITIDAEDTGAGVRGIYYSLDGSHYQLYNKPLQVDAVNRSTLFVFADDKVANRTSLFTYELSKRIYSPLIKR